MKREHIEQMLSQIDKSFIDETINQKQNTISRNKISYKVKKWAATAAVFTIVLGTGITVTAAASDTFRNWLTKVFGGHEITKVDIPLQETPVDDTAADLPADQDSHLSLTENTEILGDTESFVCQYHMSDEKMIMDQIYSVQDDGLKRLQKQRFQGTYEDADFSFEYAVINNEIMGCNLEGNINQVFHYTDGETAYAYLCEITDEVFTKGCIVRLNLKTGTIEKLTNDQAIGNMMMSPEGKVILINYRMDGYWTVFDIASRTEKKINEIPGYAHTHEIVFQDDYHVLTHGDTYKKGDVEMTGTIIIDLKTGKRTVSYKACGNYYNPQWIYKQKKDQMTVQHVNGTIILQIDGVKGTPYPLSYRGDYVLLGNLEEAKGTYYLCNLKEQTYMTIDPPSKLKENVDIYLAAKEGKILLTDGKEAYLVDVKKLG